MLMKPSSLSGLGLTGVKLARAGGVKGERRKSEGERWKGRGQCYRNVALDVSPGFRHG
jgi:hypothetical protein